MIRNALIKLLGLLQMGKPKVKHQPPAVKVFEALIDAPEPPKDEPRMTNIWGPPDDGTCQFVGRHPLTGHVCRCPGPGHARIFKRTGASDEMETIVTCAMHLPLVINGEDPETLKFDVLIKEV
jgi:hypothetical protein